MVTTKLTLADYLSLETGLEGPCEFVDGKIIEMPPESEENVVITRFLTHGSPINPVGDFVEAEPFRVYAGITCILDRLRVDYN